MLLLLGIIGLTLNTIVFTRPTLRNNSCIFYFFASTLANYPIIYFVIPCRLLADGYHIDPTTSSIIFCKLREYILTIFRSLSAWFIALASFDRLMSSSLNINYRQFCHINKARHISNLLTIIHFIFYIHIPIMYTNQIRNDQCEAPIGIYRIFNDCIYSICYIILPSILMLTFGLLTLKNLRQRPVRPTFSTINIIKRDRNLFLMIIFQCILFTCTTIPLTIEKFYKTLTIDQTVNDDFQILSNEFFMHTARMISFINHSCQFYIFTLSSKLFRQELKKYFISIKHKLIKPQVLAAITMNNEQIHIH